MANRQGEQKLLPIQSRKSTHSLSKRKGPLQPFILMQILKISLFLKPSRKSDGGRWATITPSPLSNICKGYRGGRESLCMVNGRDYPRTK